MPAKKAPEKKVSLSELKLSRPTLIFNILGVTPLILAAVSSKTKKDLLFPPRKKTAAERAMTMKHEPFEEFVNSAYKDMSADAPTRIVMPATAFKAALMTAALDIPGATKASLGRLTMVQGTYINIFGTPQIMSSVVRNSDPGKTPDIRTRAVLPHWACRIEVSYMSPMLQASDIGVLMQAAGNFIGIGDWRSEKGSGNFGAFEIVPSNDAIHRDIVENQGREVQDLAFKDPMYFDSETETLLDWWRQEVALRGTGMVTPAERARKAEA